jgi:hypothetical protein
MGGDHAPCTVNRLPTNCHRDTRGGISVGKFARASRILHETGATAAKTFSHALVRMSDTHAPHAVATLPVRRESS